LNINTKTPPLQGGNSGGLHRKKTFMEGINNITIDNKKSYTKEVISNELPYKSQVYRSPVENFKAAFTSAIVSALKDGSRKKDCQTSSP
jgi:hypothetical protein